MMRHCCCCPPCGHQRYVAGSLKPLEEDPFGGILWVPNQVALWLLRYQASSCVGHLLCWV